MSTTVRGPRRGSVVVMVLTVLMAGLAAPGYAGVSGPAIVGSLTLTQNGPGADVVFAGQCKGNAAQFTTNVSPFDVATTTATSLEGLNLTGVGPSGCLSQPGGENLTVTTVMRPQFFNTGSVITATVVLLYVVQ